MNVVNSDGLWSPWTMGKVSGWSSWSRGSGGDRSGAIFVPQREEIVIHHNDDHKNDYFGISVDTLLWISYVAYDFIWNQCIFLFKKKA